jgi:hypothetical protein
MDLESVIGSDAEDVARRTLRYKFGRLSNRGIVTRIREMGAFSSDDMRDEEILKRWFDKYDAALYRLRVEKQNSG